MKNSIVKICCLIFFVQSFLVSQVEKERWEKKETDYRKKIELKRRDYSFNSENIGQFIVKSFANAYWFFISDLDGDNCPFSLSCSNFFVESIKQTNPFQGTLMFFDRFTRDTNIFGRSRNYSFDKNGKLYDPVSNYLLDESKVKVYKPAGFIDE